MGSTCKYIPDHDSCSLMLLWFASFRQECDCDHPLYKNTWTLDETSQYTTIMSGKPHAAGQTTWCLDAGSKSESTSISSTR